MLNAVGQAQSILLLGGTSEIGLAIVTEFLSKGPAKVVLAARKNSPRLDSSVALVKAAGASEVEVIDFDATDFANHPKVIDKAFAGATSTSLSWLSAPWATRRPCGTTRSWPWSRRKPTSPARCRSGVLLAEKFRTQGHGNIIALSSVAGQRVRRSNFVYGAAKAGMDGFVCEPGRGPARCRRECAGGSAGSGAHQDVHRLLVSPRLH